MKKHLTGAKFTERVCQDLDELAMGVRELRTSPGADFN